MDKIGSGCHKTCLNCYVLCSLHVRAIPEGGASLDKRPPRPTILFPTAKTCQGKRWAPPTWAKP
ncbi:unnamed protein product [Prunus armeniaca]